MTNKVGDNLALPLHIHCVGTVSAAIELAAHDTMQDLTNTNCAGDGVETSLPTQVFL